MGERPLASPDPLTIGLLPGTRSTRRVESVGIFLVDPVVHHNRRTRQAARGCRPAGPAVRPSVVARPVASRRPLSRTRGLVGGPKAAHYGVHFNVLGGRESRRKAGVRFSIVGLQPTDRFRGHLRIAITERRRAFMEQVGA
jgi:hypothetical protein